MASAGPGRTASVRPIEYISISHMSMPVVGVGTSDAADCIGRSSSRRSVLASADASSHAMVKGFVKAHAGVEL